MGDFTQPQQKYAGTGENCNTAIPVIFQPVIFMRAENIFANMLKIVQK